MTMARNPTPRPALRKAPDATVHPAAPVAADDSRPAVVPPPKSKKADRSGPSHLRPVVGLGGSTSDVLRKAPGDDTSGKKTSSKKQKKKERKQAEQRAAAHQRRVDLKIRVPKEVRQALRKNAKARGTSVDDVVTNVLQGWLHG